MTAAGKRDSADEHDGAERRGAEGARLAFVLVSAIALIAFVLVQVVSGAEGGGAEAQAKKLMPHIRAELVDRSLSAAQLQWPLEAGDGRSLTLAQLPRDQLIFLNFWATWCPPCREELPSMFRLRQQLMDRRFMMVAVSYDEAWSDISSFFQKWVGRLPAQSQIVLLKDPILEEGRTLRETFGTKELPDSYVIYDGRVIARFVNARNWIDPTIIAFFEKLAPPIALPGDGERMP
jgi:thiol-disulfide isomerase/thioredoxin